MGRTARPCIAFRSWGIGRGRHCGLYQDTAWIEYAILLSAARKQRVYFLLGCRWAKRGYCDSARELYEQSDSLLLNWD